MNILNKIISHKKNEIKILKSNCTINDLQSTGLFKKRVVSLKNNLKSSRSGIIAEHKRKSPSKNIINDFPVEVILKSDPYTITIKKYLPKN